MTPRSNLTWDPPDHLITTPSQQPVDTERGRPASINEAVRDLCDRSREARDGDDGNG